jgi:hypothetical protein
MIIYFAGMDSSLANSSKLHEGNRLVEVSPATTTNFTTTTTEYPISILKQEKSNELWKCDGKKLTVEQKVIRAECRLAKLIARYEKKTGDRTRFQHTFLDAVKNETQCEYLFFLKKNCE